MRAKTGSNFPHIVDIRVPTRGLGRQLHAMHEFHKQRGIAPCLGRGRPEESRDSLRWYFADHAMAVSFTVEFDGKLLR